MLKDTKSLGNNKAPACESRGFVLKKEGVLFDTPSFLFTNNRPYKNNYKVNEDVYIISQYDRNDIYIYYLLKPPIPPYSKFQTGVHTPIYINSIQ